jgi:hypothetical protein
MPGKRKQSPFWRRRKPSPRYDIALLRSEELPKGQRFETLKDAEHESDRSRALLGAKKNGQEWVMDELEDCRNGRDRCDRPCCPICAREYRRWFIGELLRVTKRATTATILTVLLTGANHGRIGDLDPADWQHRLRKRLQRAGFKNTPVIGGFEVVYRAKEKIWVLHVNLLIIGGSANARKRFKSSFDGSDLGRPVVAAALTNRIQQLSYILKFTTYHRPFQRQGSTKSPAKPLNAPEHFALVNWMAKFQFKEFLFLFNARREGPRIWLKAQNN